MNFKKNIQKLIIHILKFVVNEKRYLHYELLNDYIKFNLKCVKFSEVKLYLNNNYIIKIGFESYYIYKNLTDVNYQLITDIKKIDLDNYKIEDYYHYNYGNDAIIIKLYSHLYLKNNNIKILPLNIEGNKNNNIIEFLPPNDREQDEIIENEKSTVLSENELDVLNWLNN